MSINYGLDGEQVEAIEYAAAILKLRALAITQEIHKLEKMRHRSPLYDNLIDVRKEEMTKLLKHSDTLAQIINPVTL